MSDGGLNGAMPMAGRSNRVDIAGYSVNVGDPGQVVDAMHRLFALELRKQKQDGTVNLAQEVVASFKTWDTRSDARVEVRMSGGRLGSPPSQAEQDKIETLAKKFVLDVIGTYHNAADGSDQKPTFKKSGDVWLVATGLTSEQLASALYERQRQTKVGGVSSQGRGGR